MPKKRSETPPLSQYWVPPENAGRPRACLATTFEFDAAFFEAELLPRFLGLRFDHTENEKTFLMEREDALAVTPVAVLVDQSRFDAGQTTLRWDQLAVHVPGGILHAKISVLAWERFVRVIIGSANMKRGSYRRNRELFAALNFWDDVESTPLSVFHETLDLYEVALDWTRVAPAVRERSQQAVEQVRRLAATWAAAPSDFKAREYPRVRLAATHPANGRLRPRSALCEAVERWGNRRAASVSVVTPCVGQAQEGDCDAVVEKLMEVPRSRECQAWLVVPELLQDVEDDKPRVAISSSFINAWAAAFSQPRCAYVLPLPEQVEGLDDRKRRLHGKAIMIESDEDVLLMIGSSNFTPHGMGVGVYNLEANLVYEDRADHRLGGVRLADRLQLLRDWKKKALPVADVIGLDVSEPPEDTPDLKANLPPFFAWAVYSQATGRLTLGLDRGHPEPSDWTVRLPGATTDGGWLLFRRKPRDAATSPAEPDNLAYEFAENARGINLVSLLVEWTDDAGRTQQARLGVCVDNRAEMPPPGEYRQLGANAIIECLLSGLSPVQWFDRQQRRRQGSANDASIESLRAVDTSGYLLYRVRQFGRALAGMSERILRTVPQPDAIRYRLLQDPFGPVPFAASLLASAADRTQTWCCGLEPEHRVFLLAEVLLTVTYVRRRLMKGSRKPERKKLASPFDDAESQLLGMLDEQLHGFGAGLPGNLAEYVASVRSRAVRKAEDSLVNVLQPRPSMVTEPSPEQKVIEVRTEVEHAG